LDKRRKQKQTRKTNRNQPCRIRPDSQRFVEPNSTHAGWEEALEPDSKLETFLFEGDSFQIGKLEIQKKMEQVGRKKKQRKNKNSENPRVTRLRPPDNKPSRPQ
jgi:hypothetical protein